MPNNNNLFISNFLIVNICSCKNKQIIKNQKSLIKSLVSYYIAINKPNNSNFVIFIFWIKNIYSCKNKYINIKNDNNM